MLFFPFLLVTINAQERILTGLVKSADGEELIGVTVQVEDATSRGTITDYNGRFSIKVSNGSIISFSYIGYETQVIKINNQSTLLITMQEDSKMIDEIVVVGYGLQRKETLTGSIASVSSQELLQTPVTNVSNALAGRLPGLTSIQTSGEPGKNQSLLRIRGIGTLNSGSEANPLILVDGVERSTMDDLDPNEIETLNILKDASATAVFGVKGANGVILVTTKSGISGKPRISFTANVGFLNPINLPETLNSYDYTVLKDEALRNDGYAPMFEDHYELFRTGTDPIFHSSTNYIKEFIREYSMQQQYNVNVTGGSQSAKYFISVGYMSQEGLYDTGGFNVGFNPNPLYSRYNIRSNFDFDITKRLKTSVRFGTIFSNSNYPNTDTGTFFYRLLQYPSFAGPGIVDNKIITAFINDPLATYSIPYRGESIYGWLLGQGYQDTFGNKLNLNWSFDYDMSFLTKGLSARAMIAYDNSYSYTATRKKTVDLYSVALIDSDDLSKIEYIQTNQEGNFGFSESSSKWKKVYFETALNYNRKFGNHAVTGLILFNASKEYSPTFTYYVPKSLLGIVGRVTYGYKSKYLAEYNLGYNGSEQFPVDNRFGFFPAYSLGWILTEEAFFPKNNILTYAKLRGSYGEVGNDKTGGDRFLYLPSVYTYETGASHGYYFGEKGSTLQKYTGSLEGMVGNPTVTWERAKKSNIGFDFVFFKDQLSISGDYFEENRDNILWQKGTVPGFVAANLPKVNIGKVENKGFELSLSWRSGFDNFKYWFNSNYSFARNKIIYKDEASMPYEWMNETGFSVGQYKGYRTEGFYNYQEEVDTRPYHDITGGETVQRGDLKLVDINGDGIINQYDQVPIGYTTLPEISYGFSLGASYKGLDFSILFQGVANASQLLNEMQGWGFDQGWRATMVDFKERWSVERFETGEKITQPRLSSNGAANNINAVTSNFLLKNSSYIRLKNLEMGYTFSSKFLKQVSINSFRVYLNANNLITYSQLKNVDPESTNRRGAYYPLTRVFNTGINIQF